MRQLILLVLITGCCSAVFGQPKGYNYDESKVPAYELPELLQTTAGKPVSTKEQWEKKRRGEILELFTSEVYGHVPKDVDTSLLSVVQEESANALGGKAFRRQVRLFFKARGEEPFIDMLMYLPKRNVRAGKPTPIFTGLNFLGNHTTTDDPAVAITTKWVRNNGAIGYVDNKASEESRGSEAHR